MEMKIVNEMQADLGLTAIPSSAVLDIMCQDFYDKYDKYMTVLNERKERSLRANNYSSGAGDIKVEEAAKIAAEYNKQFNQERKERRGAYFDMQTYRVHYPQNGKGRMSVLKKPKLGCYPVAMIPGQFVDGYKSYSSKELNYFPINTILAAPPKPGVTLKDLNLGSDGSESDSSDSSSGSSSDSDSEDEVNMMIPNLNLFAIFGSKIFFIHFKLRFNKKLLSLEHTFYFTPLCKFFLTCRYFSFH